MDKIKLKDKLKGYKKREISEEKEIIKSKPFCPEKTKGECPKVADKKINKKIKIKKSYK